MRVIRVTIRCRILPTMDSDVMDQSIFDNPAFSTPTSSSTVSSILSSSNPTPSTRDPTSMINDFKTTIDRLQRMSTTTTSTSSPQERARQRAQLKRELELAPDGLLAELKQSMPSGINKFGKNKINELLHLVKTAGDDLQRYQHDEKTLARQMTSTIDSIYDQLKTIPKSQIRQVVNRHLRSSLNAVKPSMSISHPEAVALHPTPQPSVTSSTSSSSSLSAAPARSMVESSTSAGAATVATTATPPSSRSVSHAPPALSLTAQATASRSVS